MREYDRVSGGSQLGHRMKRGLDAAMRQRVAREPPPR